MVEMIESLLARSSEKVFSDTEPKVLRIRLWWITLAYLFCTSPVFSVSFVHLHFFLFRFLVTIYLYVPLLSFDHLFLLCIDNILFLLVLPRAPRTIPQTHKKHKSI